MEIAGLGGDAGGRADQRRGDWLCETVVPAAADAHSALSGVRVDRRNVRFLFAAQVMSVPAAGDVVVWCGVVEWVKQNCDVWGPAPMLGAE